jgi:hypothetical protein
MPNVSSGRRDSGWVRNGRWRRPAGKEGEFSRFQPGGLDDAGTAKAGTLQRRELQLPRLESEEKRNAELKQGTEARTNHLEVHGNAQPREDDEQQRRNDPQAVP